MRLTPRQREALEFLRDDREYGDMVFEPGAGWWLGDARTNGKLALGLIRLALVSRAASGACERWRINESGRRALSGKPPYRMADGTHSDSIPV